MQVGDKFRVVTNPSAYREIWPKFVFNMDKYCGKIVTISSIYFPGTEKEYCKIKEDGGCFMWISSFLIPSSQRSE